MGVGSLTQSSGLVPPTRPRTLSKSDFKLARTCDAKLYFRENGYPDNRESDPYLAMLAEGGYMVEALAKARYPAGVQLSYGSDLAGELARTTEALRAPAATLFEATLVAGRRQARVDILDKQGGVLRLLEVKAKSFDGTEHARRLAEGTMGALRGKRKPYSISADWMEKLEDVTYQVLLLEQVLPGVAIEPYLVLVDKSKVAALDDVPSLFELVRSEGRDGRSRLSTARYIGTSEQLAGLDLVTEVDVGEEVALLREVVEAAATAFEAQLDAPLRAYLEELERGSKCAHCEFRGGSDDERSGFVHCWGALATPKPHLLELYSVGTARAPDGSPLVPWMLERQAASLLDIPLEGLVAPNDNPGGRIIRQRRQVEYTRRGDTYVAPELRANIEGLHGHVHFIDFETSRLALPYHRGMRPYGLVAFQWSAHTVERLGGAPRHQEWLNDVDVWPNESFAESLRAALGDEGPVLTWTPFERSVLKEIIADLARFGRERPELVAWMEDLFARRMLDMHDWCRCYYYHPGMRGRTSIKVVLDALWRSDEAMRRQFEDWTGLVADGDSDPYRALPAVEINGIMQDVHEGTGAMRAYQEMMYGADKRDPAVKAKWSRLLRQYCGLDTLSMVLILEHWRRVTGLV